MRDGLLMNDMLQPECSMDECYSKVPRVDVKRDTRSASSSCNNTSPVTVRLNQSLEDAINIWQRYRDDCSQLLAVANCHGTYI